MVRITGEYEATLDAKGRFLLPSKIIKDLAEDNNNSFAITTGFEGCLELYPMKWWDVRLEEVVNYDYNYEDTRFLRRRYVQGQANIDLDSANRLLIPKTLVTEAGLVKDITIVGQIDRLEIWDTKKYHKFFERFTEKMYSDLAQKVKLKNKS